MTMTQFKPHDYQWKAIEFALEHDHCGLFLPMGAGKTVTTLTILKFLLDIQTVRRILIIGPVRVIEHTWPDEVAKWEHIQGMTYSVVTGTQKQRIQALGEDTDIYLIGKENVKWLIDSRLFDFDMVVIDELSTFKNPRSQRFKALKTEMPKVDRFIGLTGTPAPKGIPDLWSQIYLMDRGERLGKTLTAFRQRYLKPGRRNGYIVYNWLLQDDAEERIYAKLSDICMSLKAEDCAELPPVQYLDYKVELTPRVKAKYRAFKREKVLSVQDDNILAANAGVLCQMLLQMTSGEIYMKDDSGKNVRTDILHEEKLKALDDLIESANGQPVLVFYYFQHEEARIRSHLQSQKLEVMTLSEDGSIEAWNSGKLDVLMLHPASGGHGLNLQQGGHIAVWYTLPNWNLELYQQANARIYRQGQKQPVTIYRLIADSSIDEDMAMALEQKDVTQKALIQALRR